MNRRLAFLLLAIFTEFALPQEAPTALVWDSDTATPGAQDGSGVWSLATSNWWDGAFNTNWNVLAADTAVFGNGGNAGSVSLDAPITVGGLKFAAVSNGTYVVQSNVMTIAGGTIEAETNAIIASALAGSGFVKIGAGDLILQGSNSLSGPVSVSAGQVQMQNTWALQGATSLTVSPGAQVRGYGDGSHATLVFPNIPTSLSGNGSGTNSGALGFIFDYASDYMVWPGSIVLSNGAAIVQQGGVVAPHVQFLAPISGTGPLTLVEGGRDEIATYWMFDGPNSYSGDTIISNSPIAAGRILVNHDNPLPVTTTLRIVTAAGNGHWTGMQFGGFTQELAGIEITGPRHDTVNIWNQYGPAAATLIINAASNHLYDGTIGYSGDNISLVKKGTGTLTLKTTKNIYTGGTIVVAGTLALGEDSASNQNNAAMGYGAVTVLSNAQLRLGGSGAVLTDYYTTNSINLVGGTLVCADGIQHFGALNISAPHGGAVHAAGPGGRDVHFDGPLAGAGTLNVACSGDGTGVLFRLQYPTNPFSGILTISNGAARVAYSNGLANATVNLTTDNAIQFGSNAVHALLGGLMGAGDIMVPAGTLAVGNNNGSTIYSGDIYGSGSLAKSGAGTLTLGGTLRHLGSTSVNQGSLQLDGALLSTNIVTIAGGLLVLGTNGSMSNCVVTLSSNGTLDVTQSAGFTPPPNEPIQGFGVVTGMVITAAGSVLSPGVGSRPGTLTFANDLILHPAYTNRFDITNSTAIGGGINDLLIVNGGFEPQGSTIAIHALGLLSTGSYRLLNYSTNAGGMSFNPAVQGLTCRGAWSLDIATVGQVNLIVAAVTNKVLRWTAGKSSIWDFSTTNWIDATGGEPERYYDMDSVLFDDGGAASHTVTLAAEVTPASMTVNSSSNYTLLGPGGISDGFGQQPQLIKDGSGTLTIATTNNYAGGTTVGGGVIAAASTTAFGVGPLRLMDNTTLAAAPQFQALEGPLTNAILLAGNSATFDDNGMEMELSGPVTGSATLAKRGAGVLTLSNANTYSNGTIVSAGTLNAQGSAVALGTGPIVLTDAYTGSNSVTLGIGPGLNMSNSVLVDAHGSGRPSISALPGPVHAQLAGPITLSNDVTMVSSTGAVVGASDQWGFGIGGGMSGPGGVTITGGGMVQYLNSSEGKVYSGNTHITGDSSLSLYGNGTNASPVNSTVQIDAGSRLIEEGNTHVLGGLKGGGLFTNNSFWGMATASIGNNGENNLFDGQIRGPMNMVKIGQGVQTLSGLCDYTGSTLVAKGVLALGPGGVLARSPKITVLAGAMLDVSGWGLYTLASFQSLEGAGVITGGIVAADSCAIIPGAIGTVATLTFANDLYLDAGTVLHLDVNAGSPSDTLVVGGRLEPTNCVIVVRQTNVLGNGSYPLITYGGPKSSGFATNIVVTSGTLPNPAGRQSYAVDESVAGIISLKVSGSNGSVRWSPRTSARWDTTATNWVDINSSTPSLYYQQDHVVFDDFGAITGAILLTSTVMPGSVTIDSSSNYSISGVGKITGYTGMLKDGSGMLSLGGTSNDYSGNVVIAGGTLRVLTASALGAAGGGTFVTDSGSLDLNGLDLGGEIVDIRGSGAGGMGSVVNNGPPVLYGLRCVRLSGDASFGGTNRFDIRGGTNAYLDLAGHTLTKVGTNQIWFVGAAVTHEGNIVANQGVLGLEAGSVVSGAGSITINTNATLQYWRDPTVLKPVAMNSGTIYCYSVACTAGAVHVLNKSCTIRTDSPIWFTNSITGQGGFTKTGASSLTLTASNTFAGGMNVTAGAVVISEGGSVASPITNNSLVQFVQTAPADTNAPSATNSFVASSPILVFGGGNTDINTPGGMCLVEASILTVTGTLQMATGMASRLNIAAGSTVNVGRLVMGAGVGSAAAISQSGGVVRIDHHLRIGSASNEISSYTLAGGSLLITNVSALSPFTPGASESSGALYVGVDGAGIFTLTGGLVNCAGLVLDNRSDTPGVDTFTMEGGTLRLGRWGIQGNASSLILLGGGTVSASTNWGSVRPLTITGTNGATSFDTTNWMIMLSGALSGTGGIRKTGAGILAISGSSNSYSGGTVVEAGTLLISASGGTTHSAVPPGRPVTIQPGARLHLAAMDALGYQTGNPSLVTLNGATQAVAAGVHASLGACILNAGTLTSEGVGDAMGNYIFDSALSTVAAGSPSVISAQKIFLRGGSSSSSVNFDVPRGSAPVDLLVSSSLMTGTADLVKSGSGIMALQSEGSISGATVVSNGVLLVNGSLGTSALTVAPDGTMGGAGIVGGPVWSSGRVVPGNSTTGVLSVASFAQDAGGVLDIEIGGTTAGVGHDRLAVGASATLAGALNVSLVNGYSPPSSVAFTILTASNVLGAFDAVDISSLGAGWYVRTLPNAVVLVHTNALLTSAPFLQCPDDVRLPCPANAVAPANPGDCIAFDYCSTGAVTVSWVGDVTNAGTGCKGNPKIITRSYEAVSTNCTPPTTNTCSQLFILEDTNGPAISVATQTLANAGFEFGSFLGWQTFGLVTNASVSAYSPRSGTFHGLLAAPYDNVCRDSSGNGFDAGYSNSVLRGQPAAASNLVFSATFDGVDDHVAAPIPLNINSNQATIVCWIKRNGNQVGSAGLVFERSGTTTSGLGFTTGDQLGYQWNGAASTFSWLSGIVPPNGQWAFVALAVSNNKAELYMKTAGSNWMSAVNNTSHAVDAFDGELRLGHDNTGGRYFKGSMDDVQIYGRTLSSNEIVAIWNGGLGGGTTNALLARYKLDETYPGGSQMGVYQDLPASVGQTWNGAIWARPEATALLRGTNRVDLFVQFLNATNGVISNAVSSVAITSATAGTNYVRLTARGNAPTNTATARLRVAYQQDGAGSGGIVYVDEAFLTATLVPAGTSIGQCGVMPNFLTSAAVTVSGDSCSGTNLTRIQSPPAGSLLTNSTMAVTISASDSCGNTSQASFNVLVDDTTVPIAFQVHPGATNLTCLTATFTNTSYIFLDNCSFGWFNTLVRSTTNNGTGCPGSARIITNVYQATDMGGNTKLASPNQVITILDNVAPVLTTNIPALADAGFESGSFATNWQTFGVNTQVLNTAPFSGTYHARLSGSGGGGTNYTGFYQELSASAGQTWRMGAWVMTPTNEILATPNRLEARIEFFDENFGLLETDFAPPFTNGAAHPGIYRQLDVAASAPAGAALVRGTLVYVQVTNAPGAVLLDDVSLSRTIYSAGSSCGATLGDLAGLAAASDCGNVTITQSPPAGATLVLGTNTVLLCAVDNCGNARTGFVAVVAADDEPPLVTGPANIFVATTNDVPAPSPAFLTNADCSAIAIVTNLPDTNNGGAGTTNNPLVITRTYLSTDAWRNTAVFQHLITVGGAGATPPPSTNVAVTAIASPAAGTNFTVRSTGTNTWSVLPEYATNLLGLQAWYAASNVSTIWSNGTNVTTFHVPTNAQPAFIRVRQTYP